MSQCVGFGSEDNINRLILTETARSVQRTAFAELVEIGARFLHLAQFEQSGSGGDVVAQVVAQLAQLLVLLLQAFIINCPLRGERLLLLHRVLPREHDDRCEQHDRSDEHEGKDPQPHAQRNVQHRFRFPARIGEQHCRAERRHRQQRQRQREHPEISR